MILLINAVPIATVLKKYVTFNIVCFFIYIE